MKTERKIMASNKIVMAGGGTGGHIFPAVAIANAIKKLDPSSEILFIGAKGKMEMEKIPQAGFRIEGLDITGFNRSSLIKNIGLPFKLIKSFFQVRRIFNEFKPDAAVGVGGYSSFPVLNWAQRKGIPTFIHESNSFAGKSNMMLGKKATKIFVAVDGMEKFFPAEKLVIAGNPVRSAIVSSAISREEAIRFFGLDPAKKTILSIGGSLGAKNINEAIDKGLHEIVNEGLQLIWQTGKPYADKARQAVQGLSGVWVNEFITQMEFAYAAADVVVSRAGAMAIAELCLMRKPAILVPYPFAAEDHQTVNAVKLEEKQAGIKVTDGEASRTLVSTVINLAKDPGRQQILSENISKLAVKNADEVIANSILKTLSSVKAI